MRLLLLCVLPLLLLNCRKTPDALPAARAVLDTAGFVEYIINAGAHFATHNAYKPVETTDLRFVARFDSSAVYQSRLPANQYDINKLYGFSDNASDHHQYSARFGWRWSDGALRLFAYVYNAGKVVSKEMGHVPIGAEIKCRIRVDGAQYLFYCNEYVQALPRNSTTPAGKGYQLYPYFGGDEAAPHEVHIWIKTL